MQLGEAQTETEFLADTGVAYSGRNEKDFELCNKRIKVVGATSNAETRPFLKPLTIKTRKQRLTHQLFCSPGAPKPLLGCDLLEKLEAEIRFKDGDINVLIPESKLVQAIVFLLQEDKTLGISIPTDMENAVLPLVWAGEVPGKAKNAEKVKNKVKAGARLVRKKQYPLK